ncbi:MAG TPA: xanthine dehydrogenase accessory protein XdhC [Clostridiales bacterium]|nr:xanthine dehydrogenase accessory protein XdhC [Clostridiales bacterium]
MKKIFLALIKAFEEGKDSVLVTIIASSGSTPRGAGARMLVLPEKSVGTIGGGAVEFAALQTARRLLSLRESRFHSYDLSSDDVENLGMVCGGRVTVCLQFISSADSHMRKLTEKALKLLSGNEDAWTITDITGGTVNGMGIYTASGLWGLDIKGAERLVSGRAYPVELGGRTLYCEPLIRAGHVYIFGAGHISRELVPTLARVDFRCIVYDDMKDFLTRELFPDAEKLICGDFGDISSHIAVTEKDYIVIVTREHKYDYTVQAQALRTPARYIGIIGSRKKIAFVTEKLKNDGFTEEDISRITSPIGLKIGAETPAEIAVSIAAQLIAIRADYPSQQ